jgi:hypothetical protein
MKRTRVNQTSRCSFFFLSLLLGKHKALCSYLHSLRGRLVSLSLSLFFYPYEPHTISVGASLFSSSFLSDCVLTSQHHNKNKNTAFRLSIEQLDMQTHRHFFFRRTQNDVNLLGVDTRPRRKKKRDAKEMSYNNRKYSHVLISCP